LNIIVLANWNTKSASKTSIVNRTLMATLLSVVMHFCGAVGLLYGRRDWFLMLTPFNLLFTFFLLLWTLPEKNKKLYFLMAAAFLIGISAEMIGIKTGTLFGQYEYGNNLGFRINGVPLLIGINWFIVVYASGMTASWLRNKFTSQSGKTNQFTLKRWTEYAVIIDGAIIATIFDLIMEPAAVKLGFWSWQSGNIPMVNYLSWFIVSAVILCIYRKISLRSHQFAINLLIIQAIFFLVLR
jgi:putative membrane protein